MPIRKFIRKLTRSGNRRSTTVTIPAYLIRQLKWREHQKVVVQKRGKGILITDWPVKSKK